jgi:hypothetical protein
VILALAGPPLRDGVVLVPAIVGVVLAAARVVLGAAETDVALTLELSLSPALDPSLLHAEIPQASIAVADIALIATVSSRLIGFPPCQFLTDL